MPKIQTITTNFTAGEQSPRVRGRVDLEKYNASAKELFNVVLLRQGGFTIRPPTKYVGEVKDSSKSARIIPFIYSRTDTYLLELGDLVMRFWKNGSRIESSPGTAYEVTTPYAHTVLGDIEYAQGADTMFMAIRTVTLQALRRFSDARWTMEAAVFNPPPVAENGDRDTMTMTISNVAVGSGRTITAGSAFFLAADVGRRISWGGGIALITAFGSSTSVTATVEVAFGSTTANGVGGASPIWLLEGSPMASCTPSAASPVGTSITLTLGAAGWRSDVVGGVVEINDGLVQVTSYSSTTIINGTILKALTGTTAAPADAWGQKKPIFNATDGHPTAVAFHQQRTWLAGSLRYPQTMIGSRSGQYFDFLPGTDDSAGVYKTIDGYDAIDYMVAADTLLTMTGGGEYETVGGIEKPITQSNFQNKRKTKWGCAKVRPEPIGNDVPFIQRGGKVMRAIRYQETGAVAAPDVSVFSEHLLRKGITFMTYQQNPESVLWCGTGDGKLLAVTYNIEQNTVAFCSGEISGGFVEWGATIPEGDTDTTYLLVRRTINGVQKRYIEKLDWGTWVDSQEIRNAHDCRMEKTGAAAKVWSGFDHLEGETVSVLADDIYVGEQVVTSGAITLTRNATKVSVGLPYVGRCRQDIPEVSMGTGTAQAAAVSVHRTLIRFQNTIGCWINEKKVPFRKFDTDETLDTVPASFTGLKSASVLGWKTGESELVLEQRLPYPWTILAVILDMTINQG